MIEFDGEFHDEELNPDSDNYKILSTHDKMKDDYCNENSLPLLRIHHTQLEDCFTILVNHFLTTNIHEDNKVKMQDDNENLIVYKDERAVLLLKLKELDEQIDYINN